MKKLLFFIAIPLIGQTTVVTVPFTLPNAVIADILIWTRTQTSSPTSPATLTADITSGATSFTISSATGYTNTDVFTNAGATLLIDNEEITCTIFTVATYSGCTRAQQSTTAAAHLTGATVQQLKYATNSSLLKALLIPGIQAALQNLASSTYLTTLKNAIAADQTALNNALNAGTVVK